jgi:hypothetical protein
MSSTADMSDTTASPRSADQQSVRHAFAVQDWTMQAATPLTQQGVGMRFVDPVVEADFVRFRTTGGRVTTACTILIVAALWYGALGGGNGSPATAVCGVVSLITFVVEIVTVVCKRPGGSLAREVELAKRHEAVTVVGWLIASVAMGVGMGRAIQGICKASADPGCIYGWESNVIPMGFTTLLIAPRIAPLVGVNAASFVMLGGHALVGYYPDPLDYVIDAVTGLGYFVAFGIAAYAIEKRERAHFMAIVETLRADAANTRAAELTRATLEAALPAPLLTDGAVKTRHHSRDSTVGIADIYSFAQWSTGHMIVDVVQILHHLTMKYDAFLDNADGVERAMTYGDSYVVCSGLLEPCVEHADFVVRFASVQLLTARGLAQHGELRGFAIRVGVSSGELMGATVGEASLRYVVVGPALDACHIALAQCGPNALVVADGASKGPSVGESDGHRSIVHRKGAVDDAEGAYGLSPCRLAFVDTDLQGAMDENRPADPANALYFAVVVSAVLAGVVIEQALDDPRRRHERHPAGLALLVTALVAAWAHYAVLRGGVYLRGPEFQLPLAAETAAVLGIMAIYSAAIYLVNCYFAEPTSGMFLTYTIRRLPGYRWYTQAAVIGVLLFACVWTWMLTLNPDFQIATTIGTFGAYPALFVTYRYFTERGACEQFKAVVVAVERRAANERQNAALELQLLGVMPRSMLPYVDTSLLRVDGGVRHIDVDEFVRDAGTVTVLQAALRFPGTGFESMSGAWRIIGAAVRDVGGDMLEMVQTTGDAFTVAGRLNVVAGSETDEMNVAAARCAMRLLGALRRALTGTASFTAVATSGSACAALMGASQITFRLFGPAVRECDALLGAAPLPLNPAASVAFVSDGFRRQERNFVTTHVKDNADAAMSVALRSATHAPSGNQTLTEATESVVGGRAAFGEPMLWRVRGVGTVGVSAVVLSSV